MGDLASTITAAAKRNGSDPTTLLADAIVESGLNPHAVGDGGTSFGLYQMHVGGAGGSTLASAKQYLDPLKSIANRARAFRGGSGGAWAASVQRPADRAGYARKVDAMIAQLRSGKSPYSVGGSASLNAPVTVGSLTAPSMGTSVGGDRQAAALSLIFGDDPVMSSIIAARQAPASGASTSSLSAAPAPTTRGIPAGAGYKWLQHEGETLFGLRNDPGNSQTIGGHHTDGSEHYKGRAVDFGNARNTPAQLAKWQAWAKAQGLDVLNEGDHIHVSLPGGGV